MPDLKSISPFWRHSPAAEEVARAIPPVQPEDFGKASGFELHFDRLMEDTDARRDTLFPTRSCR
jgi:hypothetical protein